MTTALGASLRSDITESINRYDDLHLVALPSAITCAQLFVNFTLPVWNLQRWLPEVEQIGIYLIGNAVQATGIPGQRPDWNKIDKLNRLVLRLRHTAAKLAIEVWDASQEPPLGSPPTVYRAGYSTLEQGGKVVWVEVPVWPQDEALALCTTRADE